MTATPTKTAASTSVRRFVVTIHKSGSRRFRQVCLEDLGSEYEASQYAQQHLCQSGETASHVYKARPIAGIMA